MDDMTSEDLGWMRRRGNGYWILASLPLLLIPTSTPSRRDNNGNQQKWENGDSGGGENLDSEDFLDSVAN
jgi:hypothetical protein